MFAKESRVLIWGGVVLALVCVGIALSITYPVNADANKMPVLAPPSPYTLATTFTYEGKLEDGGGPVTDDCDFQFSLFDDPAAGTQIGSTLTETAVSVVTGLFSVELDFGESFFTGEDRWMAIALRCPTGSGVYDLLSPRQAITAAPLAMALPGLYTQPNATSSNVIGGFSGNTVQNGVYSGVIAGGGINGGENIIYDHYGAIGGGAWNQVGGSFPSLDDDMYATVSGGRGNRAIMEFSTVGGGDNNEAHDYGTISGGSNNFAGWNGTVSGGSDNYANYGSTIGGGINNSIPLPVEFAVIGGGSANTVSGFVGTIAGGSNNEAVGNFSAIGGGANNIAYDNRNTIGGGEGNIVGTDDGDIFGQEFATVGGGQQNQATNVRATVCGGQDNIASGERATVGGGVQNLASGADATVSGGNTNTASAEWATVSGGGSNLASDIYATVGGGSINTASGDTSTVAGGVLNIADGNYSAIGGGANNTASGFRSTVPGGDFNSADGDYSFAAGRAAKVLPGHQGALLFSDSRSFDFSSTTSDEFAVRATGGIRFVTAIDGSGNPTAGMVLPQGSSAWEPYPMPSDVTLKREFIEIDEMTILEKLQEITVTEWSYEYEDPSIRHMGPMAQDFYAAFGLGQDERHIQSVDADGVAFAAIQGMYDLLQEKDSQIEQLERRNSDLEERVTALEEVMVGRLIDGGSSQTEFGVWMIAPMMLLGVVLLRSKKEGESR